MLVLRPRCRYRYFARTLDATENALIGDIKPKKVVRACHALRYC